VKDFDQDVKDHREKLAQGHRVRKRLDELQALSKKLVRLPSTVALTPSLQLGLAVSDEDICHAGENLCR